MTQCERIIRHLEAFGSITCLEAMQEYGIMRLASRVSDLRKSGFPVRTEYIRGKNRFGEPTCYARYILEEKEGRECGKKESRPAWFKLFRHQKALIDSVPDESAGKAIKAVFQYFENGEVPPLSPLEFAVFSSIKPYVDESFEDFAETSRKNRENVQKRWGKERRSSGNQSLPVVPVVTSCTCGNQSLPLATKNTEAEAEKIPLRDFPLSTEITHNRGAASKGGTQPTQLFVPEKPGLWCGEE